jgi:hypothetical protein
MVTYANRSGDSGVAEYAIGPDCIVVRYVNSSTLYTYNHQKPGAVHVNRMKQLAADGLGLATYIAQYVRADYYCKS